jgi:hypothetical protein
MRAAGTHQRASVVQARPGAEGPHERSRFVRPDALDAFKQLDEIIPRPKHRAVGEERAWGRRLARRFGVDSSYDEQAFVVKTNGQSGFIDHESLKQDKISAEVADLFAGVNVAKGGSLIVHGWTMAEDLVKLGSRQHA